MWLEPAPSCFSMLKPYCSATPPPPPLTTALKALVATTTEESDVGIFCYISQLPGFRGILKQRYSDFMVNEVDKEGNVVHLTNLDAPVEAVQESGTTTGDGTSKDYTTEIESFRALAGPNDAERLETFIKQINSGGEDGVMPIVLSPDYDKSHRTAVHNFFKQHFKFLVTDTVDGPDASSKCIRVRINSGGQNSRGRNSRKRKERGDKPFDSRGSEDWSEHVGKFLRFHLYKENKDTQEALGVIGKMLGVQVTVFKKLASKLAALNDRLISIKVGDFCYVTEGLVLGQLLGNRFTITLSDLEAVLCQLTLLERHYSEESGNLPNVITEAREYYKETNDIEGTLRKLPRHLVSERAILQCLKKCPGNYLQALRAFPRTLRMMYVHSYQSYLWNHAASVRVKKYGTDQVVLGDLVYCKGNETEKVTEVVSSECVDENGDDTLDPNDLGDIADTNLPEEKLSLVKAVTAEDIQSGNYTIEDVVLPMPGSRVIFPENDIADVFHDLAKKDEISLTESVHDVKYGSSFTPQLASYLTHLVSLFREFSITSVTGNYRRIFQKPMDFEWGILKYSDGTIPLVDTDLDKIAKTKPASVDKEDPASLNGDGSLHDNAKQTECVDNDIGGNREKLPEVGSLSDTNPQETQMALKLSFTLPASCYATMAIRELLKTSTSVAFHKTLN
ncbi:hypothetical protein DVH24_036754 [Malus domestica]|uniref:TRUD domain-containing protein n=1 Tax=Malus domestica TaxID=3750 RepID=A0A498IMF1_MALDO|nr:hypothetical protein DVH24_036754 [Malus domestica]